MNIFIEQAIKHQSMVDLANEYGKQLLQEAMQEKPTTCAEKYNQELDGGDCE